MRKRTLSILLYSIMLLCFTDIGQAQGVIGTSDNSDLNIISNNSYRGKITKTGTFYFGNTVNHNGETLQDSGSSYFKGDMQVDGNIRLINSNNSVSVGQNAGNSTFESVIVGKNAGLLFSGGYSVLIGSSIMAGLSSVNYQNVIGFHTNLSPSDDHNCAFGSYIAQTGWGGYNCAFGNYCMFSSTSGSNSNSSMGTLSQYSLTNGDGNSSVGYQALYSNTTGNYNTADGYNAGYYNIGSRNIWVGSNAGGSATSTNDSIDIGGIYQGKRPGGTYTGSTIIGSQTGSLYTSAVNYTLTASNYIVEFTASATATLPSMSTYGIKPGLQYVIVNTDTANTITITPSSGTINQQTSISTNKNKTNIIFDGSNYFAN